MLLGIFTGIASAISTAISAAVTVAKTVVPIAAKFISELPKTLGPVLEKWGPILDVLVTIICNVAEVLVGKPTEEMPEELGMKAERCTETEGLTEEDFNSTKEYVQYLRDRYPVSPEDVESLSVEERQKYALVGSALYSLEMGEKYAMELGPRFWYAVHSTGLEAPATVDKLLIAMEAKGLQDGDVLDGFLRNALLAGSPEREATYDALEECLTAQGVESPEIKIEELMTAYGENHEKKL